MPGGFFSTAYHINASGTVVGRSQLNCGTIHATQWKNGNPIDLGTLGGGTSYANYINDAGHICGASQTACGVTHGFIVINGEMIDLGTLSGNGNQSSIAMGLSEPSINNKGQTVVNVVGASQDSNGARHATLWTVTYELISILGIIEVSILSIQVLDLGVLPGGGESQGWTLSSNGLIGVGFSEVDSLTSIGYNAVLINNTTLQDLGSNFSNSNPFNGNSFAFFINKAATLTNYTIVGKAQLPSGLYHAFSLTNP
ncbi:hypothetical protein ACLBXI_28795 [Bacillus cereus]